MNAPSRITGRSRSLVIVLAAALALLAVVQAPAEDVYRLSPAESVLALSVTPAEPSARELLAAALLFSGAGSARVEKAQVAGEQAVKAAETLASDTPDAYERGARVLDLVYSILKRYEVLESRIDAGLIEGRYNCVGSASLYTILARAAGLSVRGVILDDHAYCYLLVDGRRIDVETTNPQGYDDAMEDRKSLPSRDASPKGVMALVLRNRATLSERSGGWVAALGLAVDAYAYDPGELTLETLSGRINNSVGALLRAGRYADSLTLADAAITRYGSTTAFSELRDTARLAVLTDTLRTSVPSDALALAETVLASGQADADWVRSAFSWAYAGLAEERRKAGDHLGAWEIASGAAARFRDSRDLASLERTAQANWVKSAHNRFASLYNAGQYREALATIQAALLLAPDERILNDDTKAAEAAVAASMMKSSP
jgi:tetratricopeptide (TPR) repeat protein